MLLAIAPPLQAEAGRQQYAIEPQPLARMVREVAAAGGMQLLFSAEEMVQLNARGLNGWYTTDEALTTLLENTGLVYEITSRGVIIIKKRPSTDAPAEGKPMKTSKWWMTGLLGSLLNAGTAHGQLPDEVQPRATGTLEEVVVTARRRSESMQEVPVAITALGGDYLEQNSIRHFEDIQHHAPSLTVTSAGATSNNPVISLRGQRPVESNIDVDPAVPLYFADVVLTPSYGTNLALYDLQNVQVIKGPQGTLFGRNSTGGAVLFTPRRPGSELGGQVRLAVGNYGLIETEAGIDLPVSDRLRFRVAGKSVDRDGYQKNVAPLPQTYGDEYWDERSHAIRFSVEADITDSLQNYAVLSWDRIDSQGRQSTVVAYNPALVPQLLPDVLRTLERDDPTRVESDQPGQFEDVESTFFANTTTLDLGGLTFKNVFGYRKVEWANVMDGDGSARAIANHISTGEPSTAEGEQFSNELQLLGSALEERLDWIAGLYYYQMQATRLSRTNVFGRIDNIAGGDVDNSAYAVFAQANYEIVPDLKLTVGARMSWDEREITAQSVRIVNQPGVGRVASCQVRDEQNVMLPLRNCGRTEQDDWSALTWLVSLSYNLSDSTMLYGAVNTGYRTGGFSLRGTNNTDLTPFDEENVIAYELGAKSDWSLGRWQFRTNAAVFYQDFTDIQRTTIVPDPNIAGSYVTLMANAADAEISGAELEVIAMPTDRLTLSLNYAYVKTEYGKYLHPALGDFSGDEFGWVPDDQVTLSLRYELPLNPALGTVSAQANYYYQSDMLGSIVPPTGEPLMDSARDIGSYSLHNYRLDWQTVMGSAFDIAFYINNARNEKYPVGAISALNALGIEARTYGAPRTYGAALTYRF